ncbi:MAG: DUF1566 domain-containing protein [Spirochaetales bacterium]|nr:DUF1566 domain-containing protein [Spirochaetales bacterium]
MKIIGLFFLILGLSLSSPLFSNGTGEEDFTIIVSENLTTTPSHSSTGEEIRWEDIHGAGSLRADLKTGDPALYSQGNGPRGEVVRILNMVRPVRSFSTAEKTYAVVDTNQTTRFGEGNILKDGELFFGQDGDYTNLPPSYRDNGDGTVSDLNTGLMWVQSPEEITGWTGAAEKAAASRWAGYDDWRLPTLKELSSLLQYSGGTVNRELPEESVFYIDTDYFTLPSSDGGWGPAMNRSCALSSTQEGSENYFFCLSFLEGQIFRRPKAEISFESEPDQRGPQPLPGENLPGEETSLQESKDSANIGPGGMPRPQPTLPEREETFALFLVRGNSLYGLNHYVDNGDGTVSDLATGLMWTKDDMGPMNWKEALLACEDLRYAGYDDWRLPQIKELISLVDYSRSPDFSDSAALDPHFTATSFTNEAGQRDYGFYWSSTTYVLDSSEMPGALAACIAFGRSLGNLSHPFMPGMMGGGGPGGPMGQGDTPLPPPEENSYTVE